MNLSRSAAVDARCLVGNLEKEFSRFKMTLTVVADKCQVLGGQVEGHGAQLAGLEVHLGERAQTAALGDEACHYVTGEEQDALLACHAAGILDVDAHGEHVTSGEVCLVNTQVAVFKCGVTQAVAEGPLHIDLGIVVIHALHGARLLTDTIVVGRE